MTENDELSFGRVLLLDILISSILTTGLSIGLSSINSLSYLFPSLAIVTIVFDLVALAIGSREDKMVSVEISIDSIKTIIPMLFIVAGGILVIMWRGRWFPWPESWGTDLIYHLFYVKTTVVNNGSSFLFSSYPRQFHTILAGMSLGSGLNPYLLLYYGPFIIYPLALLLVYLLAKSLTENTVISFLSAMFFPFVNDIGALLGPHYFYPSTYAFIIMILSILAVRENLRNLSLLFAGIGASVALVFVYPYALFGIAPFLAYWAPKFRPESKRANKVVQILFLGSIAVFLLIITAYYLPVYALGWNPVHLSPPKPFGFLTIESTLEHNLYVFQRAYSILQILLLVLGLVSVIYKGFWSRKEPRARDIALLVVFYLATFFLPMRSARRMEMYIRPLNILCMVYGAYAIGQAAIKSIRSLSNLEKSNIHELALIIAVTSILIVASYPTAVSIDNDLKWESHYPHEDEYAAFEWLDQNCPKDGYILTDPATGFIMRSFILRNASTSMISGEAYYSLGAGSRLGQNIFSFFNSSSWNETEYYEQIANYMGRVDYIVISPRTTDWLKRTREGGTIAGARYVQVLFPSDPAWGKFLHPRYSIEKQFGKLYILRKNDVSIYYEDNFANVTSWYVNSGNPPESDGDYGTYENSQHPADWYHLYTNIPSFANTSGLALQVRYRSNITGMEGKIFGFSENQMKGQDVFETRYIYPNENWSVQSWNLSDIANTEHEGLESISLGFHCSNASWRFYIDYIKIFGTAELQYPYKEEMVIHYFEPFENVSLWSVNAGGEPAAENGVGYYENSAYPGNWYHMYTNALSFENQTNLYVETRFRVNTSGVSGRIFGYKGENRTQDKAFYSEYLPLGTKWVTKIYQIETSPGHSAGPLESLSFGLTSSKSDWRFFVSELRIFELVKAEIGNNKEKLVSTKENQDDLWDNKAINASSKPVNIEAPFEETISKTNSTDLEGSHISSCILSQFLNAQASVCLMVPMESHQLLLYPKSLNQEALPQLFVAYQPSLLFSRDD